MEDIKPRRQRRDPRVPARLEVDLQMPEGHQHHITHNVSYRGVFIACDDPLSLGRLVRFRTIVREGDDPIQMLGLVAHRVNTTEAEEAGVKAGMGLNLFSLGPDHQRAWRHFVRTAYEADPAAREHVRSTEFPRIRLALPDAAAMRAFAEHNVPEGNIFLRSADLHPQGSRLFLDLSIGRSRDTVAVEGIVMEFVEAPRQNRGMRISFTDPDRAQANLVAHLEAHG